MIANEERIASFVGQRVGFALCPPYSTMGIERDGEVIAAVVFNMFEGSAVHVTAAGHGWTKGFLRSVGRYVFDQLGCARMTIQTEQPEIVRLAERLGGQVEALLRSHFGDGRDAFVVGILRNEYRFLWEE